MIIFGQPVESTSREGMTLGETTELGEKFGKSSILSYIYIFSISYELE